jgi:hypothetical protein
MDRDLNSDCLPLVYKYKYSQRDTNSSCDSDSGSHFI